MDWTAAVRWEAGKHVCRPAQEAQEALRVGTSGVQSVRSGNKKARWIHQKLYQKWFVICGHHSVWPLWRPTECTQEMEPCKLSVQSFRMLETSSRNIKECLIFRSIRLDPFWNEKKKLARRSQTAFELHLLLVCKRMVSILRRLPAHAQRLQVLS